MAIEESDESDATGVVVELARLDEPWAVRVAATLRLADLIAEEGTALDELSTRAGADRDALGRVLRFLSARGVFAETSRNVFAPTAASSVLRDEHPAGLRRWFDLDGAAGAMDRAYAGLLDTVRTGTPAYPKLRGRSFWEDLAADDDLRASFASLMAAHSDSLAEEVITGYPWARYRLVADVGGGTGTLLTRILSAYPKLRGVLIDLVANSAEAADVIAKAGVADRCEVAATDFFGPLIRGADVYVLRNIIHDWPDEQAVRILRRGAEAAGETGRVLVVDRVVGEGSNQHELTGMDLRMLVLFASRERTLDEFNELAAAAGMSLVTARANASAYWILEYASSS
ncbi:MAG: methyltransferase [Candidatus Dormibacteria bacterium]